MPANSLLFLDFEGVLVVQNASKIRQIAEALKTIGSGKAVIEDFQDLWPGLFERRARDYLKVLPDIALGAVDRQADHAQVAATGRARVCRWPTPQSLGNSLSGPIDIATPYHCTLVAA